MPCVPSPQSENHTSSYTNTSRRFTTPRTHTMRSLYPIRAGTCAAAWRCRQLTAPSSRGAIKQDARSRLIGSRKARSHGVDHPLSRTHDEPAYNMDVASVRDGQLSEVH